MTKSLKWTLTGSQTLIQDQWIKLRADRCKTPSGGTVEPYYVLEYPDWVNVVAVTRNEQVVMVRQYRHGLAQTLVELPGGAIDSEEVSPLAAIQRELQEETGYGSDNWQKTGEVAPNPASHTNLTHCFVARGCELVGEPRLDENEEIDVVLWSIDEFVDRTLQGKLLQAQHVTSAMYALINLGRVGPV